ncbi:MAG: NADPH:quinone oxidoreductase family protein [Paracoccaceae bacterium]
MKAFGIIGPGAAPGIMERDIPRPGPGEVRVRIAACGINFADLLMVDGKYQERPEPPVTLGMEPAGWVDALGAGVSGLDVGTRVAVFANCGGLADFGCFPVERCTAIPDAMSFDDAAAFQIAYGTSHLALAHKARLQPGETLLVLGAAGGVGLTAVEIGKRMGARVVAAARGADRLRTARAAGADQLIDSATADLRAEVKALGGADVVYDPVGGDQFDAAFRATNPDGRILVIGFAGGRVQQIPTNHLLVKNISVIGLYWGGYAAFAPRIMSESLSTLFGWYAAGGLRPHISHTLPLERAGEALDLLRARKSTGKIVVRVGDAA